ncbi:MAG: hypothetical protein JWO31_787, partial [Phycisphaerales bacterium]|nr:hypothetical protein [Phycisphaerales bacterium]
APVAPLTPITPRAKSVIFLYQFGGPSHLDMFDMKPNAPEAIRGPYKPMSSAADGIQVSERLPRVAKIMDKVTLVRSMTHTMKNHNSAAYYALSGHAPPTDDQRLKDTPDLFPSYGSVVDLLAPLAGGDMPTSVAYPHLIRDGSVTPGQRASFLGKAHDPFFFAQDPAAADFKLPELTLPAGVDIGRLESRRGLQKLVDHQSRMLDYSAAAAGIDAYYDKALAMLNSPRLRQAFDLSAEPDVVREAYGRHTYGQSCLLARRLVEAGSKFVTVYFSDSIGGRSTENGGWDTHGFDNTRMFPIIEKRHLPITEQTLPTLLTDLENRGMLDETLVVWMGEFGRTPKINAQISRDHWPQCYTALLAGGGVKRGYVHGASDKHGMYPADAPVRPDDLAATMYHLLGIDPATEVRDLNNRPVPISYGKPVTGIMA